MHHSVAGAAAGLPNGSAKAVFSPCDFYLIARRLLSNRGAKRQLSQTVLYRIHKSLTISHKLNAQISTCSPSMPAEAQWRNRGKTRNNTKNKMKIIDNAQAPALLRP